MARVVEVAEPVRRCRPAFEHLGAVRQHHDVAAAKKSGSLKALATASPFGSRNGRRRFVGLRLSDRSATLFLRRARQLARAHGAAWWTSCAGTNAGWGVVARLRRRREKPGESAKEAVVDLGLRRSDVRRQGEAREPNRRIERATLKGWTPNRSPPSEGALQPASSSRDHKCAFTVKVPAGAPEAFGLPATAHA